MKSKLCVYLKTAVICIALTFSINAFATEQDTTVDHHALASFYESQVHEMHAKIGEQIDALKQKSQTSYLGKHAKEFKKHVKYKIHECEKIAKESMEKADYHKQMAAEQSFQPAFAKSSDDKS